MQEPAPFLSLQIAFIPQGVGLQGSNLSETTSAVIFQISSRFFLSYFVWIIRSAFEALVNFPQTLPESFSVNHMQGGFLKLMLSLKKMYSPMILSQL